MKTARATLLLYRAGLLEPEDASDMADKLASSGALRRRLRALGETDPVAPPLPSWRVPPPGWGTAIVAVQPQTLSDGRVRAGDAFHLDVPDLTDADEREIVVLRRVHERWEVIAPAEPADRTRLNEFPVVGGLRRVNLLARGPAGRQRWAVALPRWRASIRWKDDSDQRWAWLQDEISTGAVVVGSADIEVA